MKVFILPVTHANLFPFTIRPMVIQSVAQAQLIQQAISENVPVAIAFHIEQESTYRTTAGYGHPYIADQKADGSILIYIQGQGKVDLSHSQVLPTGVITYHEVKIINENIILNEKNKNKYEALSKYFAHWIDRYLVDPNQKDFSAESHLFIRLRVIHPTLALISVSSIIYWLYTKSDSSKSDIRLALKLFFAMLVGIITILTLSPVWLKLAHLLIAHFIWAEILEHQL